MVEDAREEVAVLQWAEASTTNVTGNGATCECDERDADEHERHERSSYQRCHVSLILCMDGWIYKCVCGVVVSDALRETLATLFFRVLLCARVCVCD